MNDIKTKLEAVLFASGEAVSIARLSLVFQVPEEEIFAAASVLDAEYTSEGRALRVLRLGDYLQMCSSPEFADIISAVLEKRKPSVLSQPALETLAIVAYYQPVTQAYVSKIRGVDSAYTVSSLCDKGLIEVTGRLDAPGRPALYETTSLFLRTMGISSLEELPELPDISASDGIERIRAKIDELKVEGD